MMDRVLFTEPTRGGKPQNEPQKRKAIESWLTEQMAGSASPRKPKLATPTRSAAERIFDVA